MSACVLIDSSERQFVELVGQVLAVLDVGFLVGFSAQEAGDAVPGEQLLSCLIRPYWDTVFTASLEGC